MMKMWFIYFWDIKPKSNSENADFALVKYPICALYTVDVYVWESVSESKTILKKLLYFFAFLSWKKSYNMVKQTPFYPK